MRMHLWRRHHKLINKTAFEKAVEETGVLTHGLPSQPTVVCERPVAGLLLQEAKQCGECPWVGTRGMGNHYRKQHPGIKKPAKLSSCSAQRFNTVWSFFKVAAQPEPAAEDDHQTLLDEFSQRQAYVVEQSGPATDVRNMTAWARFTGWMGVVDGKSVEALLATVEPPGKWMLCYKTLKNEDV